MDGQASPAQQAFLHTEIASAADNATQLNNFHDDGLFFNSSYDDGSRHSIGNANLDNDLVASLSTSIGDRIQASNQNILDERHEKMMRDRQLFVQAQKRAASHKAGAQSQIASGASSHLRTQHRKFRGSIGGRYAKEDERGEQGVVTWWTGDTGARTVSDKAKGKQRSEEENKHEVDSANADDEAFLNQLFAPNEVSERYESAKFLRDLRLGVPPAASASSTSSNSRRGGYSPTMLEQLAELTSMPQLPSELPSHSIDLPLSEASLYENQAPFSSIASQENVSLQASASSGPSSSRQDGDSSKQPSGFPTRPEEYFTTSGESTRLGNPTHQPLNSSSRPADYPSQETLSYDSPTPVSTMIPQIEEVRTDTTESLLNSFSSLNLNTGFDAWHQSAISMAPSRACTPVQHFLSHPTPMILCEPLPYPYQTDPFQNFVTAGGDYARAKPRISNEDIEMEQADAEMEELQDGPSGALISAATFAFEAPQACFPLQDISMEDVVHITGYNIDSTAMAVEVWNGPPVQDISIANAIQSPECAIKYPALEEYDAYQCQAPIYTPQGYINESFLINTQNATPPNWTPPEGVYHFNLISNQFVSSITMISPVSWILLCVFDRKAQHWVSIQPIPTSLPTWLTAPSDKAPIHSPDYDMEVEEPRSENPQLNVEGELDEVTGHPVGSPSPSRDGCQYTTGPRVCLEENKGESQNKTGISKEHTPAPIPFCIPVPEEKVQDTGMKKRSRDEYETSELTQPAIDVAEFASESGNLSPAKRQKLPCSEMSENIRNANRKNKRTREVFEQSTSYDPNTRPAKRRRTIADAPPQSPTPPRNSSHILDPNTRPAEESTIPHSPTNKPALEHMGELKTATVDGLDEGMNPPPAKKCVRFVTRSHRWKEPRRKRRVDPEPDHTCTMLKDLGTGFNKEHKRREAAVSASVADSRAEASRTAARSDGWPWSLIRPIAGFFGLV